MAHCTPGPPTARFFTDGTICPDWYDNDGYAFQSAQGAYTPHESPTIAGTSVQGSVSSTLELSTPVSATHRTSLNKAFGLNATPKSPAKKESRQRQLKACARCRKTKIKCILKDGNPCQGCNSKGVPCVPPAARRSGEQELTGRSSKAPKEEMATALLLENSNLKEELCKTTEALEAARLEITRLTAEAQNCREQSQHALVLTSRTASVSRHCAPVQEAGGPMSSPSLPTVPSDVWGHGTQAYQRPRVDVQQQHLYQHDIPRHWYHIDQAATHGAQVQGAHSIPRYEW